MIWVCSSVAWLLCAIFLGVFLRTTQIGLARLGPRSPGRPRKGGEGRRVGDPTLRFFFFFSISGARRVGGPKCRAFFPPSPAPFFAFVSSLGEVFSWTCDHESTLDHQIVRLASLGSFCASPKGRRGFTPSKGGERGSQGMGRIHMRNTHQNLAQQQQPQNMWEGSWGSRDKKKTPRDRKNTSGTTKTTFGTKNNNIGGKKNDKWDQKKTWGQSENETRDRKKNRDRSKSVFSGGRAKGGPKPRKVWSPKGRGPPKGGGA